MCSSGGAWAATRAARAASPSAGQARRIWSAAHRTASRRSSSSSPTSHPWRAWPPRRSSSLSMSWSAWARVRSVPIRTAPYGAGGGDQDADDLGAGQHPAAGDGQGRDRRTEAVGYVAADHSGHPAPPGSVAVRNSATSRHTPGLSLPPRPDLGVRWPVVNGNRASDTPLAAAVVWIVRTTSSDSRLDRLAHE